jgi:thioesterase domain-containing protein
MVERIEMEDAGAGEDPPRDQWEETVAALWARVLGLDEVGVHDDFAELGGDPPAAEELLGRVADELGLQLPASTVVEAPTVAEFAVRVKTAAARAVRHPSVVPLQVGGERTPLFCFSGAGGLAVGLLTLARHFGGQRPVYGLQAHGLERRGIPDWTVRAAARRHARHMRLLCPHGPYVLVGHSLGGLIAYEAARILRAAGADVALVVAVDCFLPSSLQVSRSGAVSPPSITAEGTAGSAGSDGSAGAGIAGGSVGRSAARPPAADGDMGGRLAQLRVLAGRVRQLVQLPFAGVVQFRGMNQFDVFYNLGKVMTLSHRMEPYDGRTLVLLADGRQDADAWRDVLTGPNAVRQIDGCDHDSMLREPMVAKVAAEIQAELDDLGI